MLSKQLLFSILISGIFFSCATDKKKEDIRNYSEEDKGDSIIYYKDFDLYSFKGRDKLNADSLSYPFVKMVYRNDSLVLKAHYNKGKTSQLLLFKLNNQWCNHSHHWSDGVTSHHFKVFTDTALYEFKFHRNPYGKTAEDLERPAELYSITVESKNNNIVKYRYYQSFDWGSTNYRDVPDVSKVNEKDWLNNCESLIISHEEIINDTIRQSHQSYRRVFRNGEYQELEKDGNESLIKIPLILNSEFYTRFARMGR
jgi:hypothetical protein